MKNNKTILIQPQFSQIEEYELLCRTENLQYEILELSFPEVLDSTELDHQISEYSSRKIHSLHGVFLDINVASKEPKVEAVSKERSRQSCEIAKKLGIENIIFHTGFFPYLDDVTYLKEWAERCGIFYSELQKEFGLQIFIENCMDKSPKPLRLLMECTPSLRVCLDVGHVNYGYTPIEDWFSQLEPYIGYLHFSDNLGVYDNHLPLGEGTCQWHKIDRLCRSLKGDIPVTLEVGGPDCILQSIDYLKRNLFYPFT